MNDDLDLRRENVKRFAAAAESINIDTPEMAEVVHGILETMERGAAGLPEGDPAAAELRQGAIGIRTALLRYDQEHGT